MNKRIMNSTNAPHLIEHIKHDINFTPNDTKFIPRSARFVACGVAPNGKGTIGITELCKGEIDLKQETISEVGIKCATFGASPIENRSVALGHYDGELCILDLEDINKGWKVKAHDGLINCLDGIGGTIGLGAPELVTGGRDGIVKVWDPRVDYPVTILEPESNSSHRDCWSVCFGNSYNESERCVAAGYDNGDVKLFDLRRKCELWTTNANNGVTGIEFDRRDIEMNKLLVTSLESKFQCYDMRTMHPTVGYSHLEEKAHRSTIWLGKHMPQNRDIFATLGGNGGFNIYKYNYPLNRVGKHAEDGAPIGVMGSVELLNSRVISTQPIVSFDWSPDRAGLAVLGSLDQSIRVYIVTKVDSM
jgi:WD40 repeat protein